MSWYCPLPAKPKDMVLALAYGSARIHAGYFMVALEPMLPSTHSMVPPSRTYARWVTRLYTLLDQFCTVV